MRNETRSIIYKTLALACLLAAPTSLTAQPAYAARLKTTKKTDDSLNLTPLQAKQFAVLKAKAREEGKKTKVELSSHKKMLNSLLSEPVIDRQKILVEQAKIETLQNAIERSKLTYKLEIAYLLTPKQRSLLKQMSETKTKHKES